jgi:hypothetical protein
VPAFHCGDGMRAIPADVRVLVHKAGGGKAKELSDY